MDVQTRHGGQLKAIPGLRGVGVDFIEENGELTDVLGIQVWVDPTHFLKELVERTSFRGGLRAASSVFQGRQSSSGR